MPYKAIEPRRHKIPRARYKVANWPDYDRALQQRGQPENHPDTAAVP